MILVQRARVRVDRLTEYHDLGDSNSWRRGEAGIMASEHGAEQSCGCGADQDSRYKSCVHTR